EVFVPWTTYSFFTVYRSSLLDPLTYVRLFTYVLGHSGWEHLFGNMMYILLLGPMLEEKYGSKTLIVIMAVCAFSTAIINLIFFPRISLMGASGIVFCFIMLSSITGRDNTIPLTLIITLIFYLGSEVYDGLVYADNISQLSHIIGGLVGTFCGFYFRQKRIDF
ncbi:MAG: rhomboid family intramembrane serine protease, partial [Erysipelotrichaceae bacterium]|nr:rhomboid family intramembrane serine protease [Erysipelotrichaceae bacterium]